MDSLDFNVHSAILTALAQSYASPHPTNPNPGEPTPILRNLPEAGNIVSNAGTQNPASNSPAGAGSRLLGAIGVSLSKVNGNGASPGGLLGEGERELVTRSQAHHTIAYAAYASRAATSATSSPKLQSHSFERLLGLLQALPNWDVEETLAVESPTDCPLVDELAERLVAAVLDVGTAEPGFQDRITVSLQRLLAAVAEGIQTKKDELVISHYFPILMGFRRAFVSTAFPFSATLFAEVFPNVSTFPLITPEPALMERINLICEGNFGSTSSTGRHLSGILERYELLGRPLTLGAIGHAAVQACRVALQQTVIGGDSWPPKLGVVGTAARDGWTRLVEFQGKSGGGKDVSAVRVAGQRALELYDEALSVSLTLEPDDDSYIYNQEILSEALKLATVSSVSLGKLDVDLYEVLATLHSERAPIYDQLVQITGTECLIVLARSFPSLLSKVIKTFRRYVTSPLLLFDSNSSTGPSDALLAAAHGLAICIGLFSDSSPDIATTTMYSLLNHLKSGTGPGTTVRDSDSRSFGSSSKKYDSDSRSTTTNGGGGQGSRSDDEKRLVSIDAVVVVSAIARELKQADVTSLVTSMLLQRLKGTDTAVEAAILVGLADVASSNQPGDHRQLFEDVITTFSSVSKTANLEDPDTVNSAVLTAQTRLAQGLVDQGDSGLCESYLKELLTLFVEKSKHIQSVSSVAGGEGKDTTRLLNHLVAMIPVIGTLLYANPGYNPRYSASEDLVALFRNFWFLCVLFGFLTPGNPGISEWQRASMTRVAIKTPPLTRFAPADYLENELEFNSLLRHDNTKNSASGVRQKAELAAALPSHAGQARGMTHAQVTFLLTVLRVECLRAGDCKAAPVLEYVNNEGLSDSALFGCLSSIADKVLATFIASFQQQATRHSVDKCVYKELCDIVKQCCHHLPKVRATSLRYMQNLVAAFPTLLCHGETVNLILETLTLLREACEGEYEDEYSPIYSFHSQLADLTVVLPDDYTIRDTILNEFHKSARYWLSLAVGRAPLEMQSLLQRYIEDIDQDQHRKARDNEMGKSLAIDLARLIPSTSKSAHLPSWGGWKADSSSAFATSFGNRKFYRGEADGILANRSSEGDASNLAKLRAELKHMSQSLKKEHKRVDPDELRKLLYRAGAATIAADEPDYEVLHQIVSIPVRIFTPAALSAAQEVWAWLVDARPAVEVKLMTDVITMWGWTIRRHRGLFSPSMNVMNPLDAAVRFVPTDKEEMDHQLHSARRLLQPHALLLDFLSSRFQAARYQSRSVVLTTLRLLVRSLSASSGWCTHPLSRELRLRLLTFAFTLLQGSRMEANVEFKIRDLLYDAAFSWFAQTPSFAFGNSRAQQEADVRLLRDLQGIVRPDSPSNAFFTTSQDNTPVMVKLPGNLDPATAAPRQHDRHHLLQLLIENELVRLLVWLNPLNDPKRGKDVDPVLARGTSDTTWRRIVQTAWAASPHLAVHLNERFKIPSVGNEVTALIRRHPERARAVPEALPLFIGDKIDASIRPGLRHVLYWKKVPAVNAITYFLPQYDNDPTLLQCAMRMLEEHDVEVVFFYIPQVVQALRTDALGYVERFISETAKVSQLFCHQIIWNMKANTHKDDAGEEVDPMKPLLDRMVDLIVSSLSGEAKSFYEREFGFFDEVTGISRKLQAYLKKSKAEKKAKIAEELAKIKVDKGVYLPSNPDGSVVDIDRNSGRPLQSHAKTPFMATFKVHREKKIHYDEEGLQEVGPEVDERQGYEEWQAAIFKVGDDCRQDVLALQVIAMHKAIFESLSLDLHLFPYRVTATAPGCGVIDVVPNATSRDEMGRAQINDLNTFFVGKFGAPDTPTYQVARMNFIRSMAAYSVMCYLIQIKDRHNGNIMIDGEGHITHIDFGFLFDIGPGGIKFEPSSFKLTHEMIVVMGGLDSAGYRMFKELVVKAFLVARPFSKEIVSTVKLMSGTALPSFKGEGTMVRLMDRFKPGLTEREAATYCQGLIANAEENKMSLVYDEFQRITNEIPYTR